MTFSDRAVEAAAKALCIQSGDDPDKLTYAHAMQCTGHNREPKYAWQYWLPFAEAALAAALAVDGLVLVPREPTEEMLDAGACYEFQDRHIVDDGDISRDVYRAMLSAAPTGTEG